MNWRRIGRVARWLLVVPALEIGYLLVSNAVLFSGVIQRAASAQPEQVELAWDRAYSLWPGRAYVTDLRLRLQDSHVQFRLTVDSASVDVDLLALLHKEFHTRRIRAQGVSYRMLVKVASTAGIERRVPDYCAVAQQARTTPAA